MLFKQHGSVAAIREHVESVCRRLAPYDPPFVLRMAARRWPHFAWLCHLPPSERGFYVCGPNADYHRRLLFGDLPEGVWRALKEDA